MAEKKYDLLLHPPRDSNLKIRNQPWYRERLKTKYCKPGSNKDHSSTLDASSWTFIKDGLDDFRDGMPPSIDDDIRIKGNKGIKPTITNTGSFDGIHPKQRVKKDLSKDDVIYSKSIPSQRKRIQRVNNIEENLLGHPLTLHPHIEESIPHEMFEEIVDILDPSLKLYESDEMLQAESESHTPELQDLIYTESNDKLASSNSSSVKCDLNDKVDHKTALKWLQSQEQKEMKEEKRGPSRKRQEVSQETQIEGVTKEFCDWVRGLGGESNNIEESTVNSLFASGYETKPTLSVPVHVVELTNVPPELRADGRTPTPQHTGAENETEQTYTPSWVKVRYGAWYLDPKSWKVLPANHPLQDPKELEGLQMSESKKKSKELDGVLSSLHGARAFRKFVDDKGTRKPEFLESVSHQEDPEFAEAEELWSKRKSGGIHTTRSTGTASS